MILENIGHCDYDLGGGIEFWEQENNNNNNNNKRIKNNNNR